MTSDPAGQAREGRRDIEAADKLVKWATDQWHTASDNLSAAVSLQALVRSGNEDEYDRKTLRRWARRL